MLYETTTFEDQIRGMNVTQAENGERQRLAYVALAAAGILAVVVILGVPPKSNSSKVSSASTASGPCSSRVPVDPLPNQASESSLSHRLDNGSVRSVVFMMQPGTPVTLCITYHLHNGSDLSASNFTIHAFVVHANLASGQYSYTAARNVNLTLDATSLNMTDLRTIGGSVTIDYSVASSPNISGFYTISYPFNCPPWIPFAIVNGGLGSVSASDFPGFFAPSSCMTSNTIISSEITGFSNMSAEWITA